jgi:hypothetical protein
MTALEATKKAFLTAGLVPLFLLLRAGPGSAQLAPINFPDTVVGQSSTVKCPTTSVNLCFGSNCSGSGTVQSVSGPSPPFSIGKFNLLTNSQFFGGNCEANPVSLPVTVGPNQLLGYQATFSPSAAGTSTGTLTFSTSGGPATVNLTGRGIPSPNTQTGQGLIDIQFNSDNYVPGSFLDLSYRTRPGTLQGPVDLYFAASVPTGELLFLTSSGAFVTAFEPFRRNVTIADETASLFSIFFPVDLQFGTYTCYMALVHAGTDATDSRNWASPVSQSTVSYTPLSPVQQSIMQSREGNPDFLVAMWLPELLQKQETWVYLSGNPIRFVFLNGNLQTQEIISNASGGPGPKVNPGLFTPQTTLDQLMGAFGPPASMAPIEGLSGFQAVSYSFGLDVVLRNGRLSTATTSNP